MKITDDFEIGRNKIQNCLTYWFTWPHCIVKCTECSVEGSEDNIVGFTFLIIVAQTIAKLFHQSGNP